MNIKLNVRLWATKFTKREKSVSTKKEGLNEKFENFQPWVQARCKNV